eukprot:TRINITY_DN10717_c0_g1_i1.p1 TRINITY_DN10717_c0_g1~~TRINITY_DN10717_c0_g1_i1.p1  ORF type:complete len:262 (-),score=55.38 TRINITY_DN10717_c0_g1_i1:92-877(-)
MGDYFRSIQPLSPEEALTLLKGSTLLLPTMSVGNVPQLAIDFFIQSWDMKKVGFLDDESVLPVVGINPYDQKGKDGSGLLALALEVYHNKDKGLTVIQQRAPLELNQNGAFSQRLSNWIASCKFSRVFILHASFSSYRVDSQLEGPQVRQLIIQRQSDSPQEYAFPPLEEEFRPSQRPGDDNPVYSKGGFLRKFTKACFDLQVPTNCLITFCAEGDNIPDAANFASWANFAMFGDDVEPTKWQRPSCWEKLHGASVVDEIF